MKNSTGMNTDTWHPVPTSDTTLTSYWLNWRFFLCSVWVLVAMTIASLLIWKNEQVAVAEKAGIREEDDGVKDCLYSEETWRPCLKGLHPAWLLVFRIFAFFLLLVLLVYALLVDGTRLFYYYTHWTFTLVTLYFALGVVLSVHGCLLYSKNQTGSNHKVISTESCAERGQSFSEREAISSRFHQPADKLAYAFQIIYQVNAGAVMLTDCVFWFIIVPFLASKDYHISPLTISMHSMNAVFLYGDTVLNCMRFPWFRIAYFFLWTTLYVLFMWIVHSCFNIWWPYPFLDLSSPYSPLWYFVVGIMHLPCYGVFSLIVKMKKFFLSKWLPESFVCAR